MLDLARLQQWTGQEPSALGLKVAQLLDGEVGFHNIYPDIRDKVDWSDDYIIAVPWPRHFSLATIDGDRLTRLVVRTHDLMMRMEIVPRHYRWVELRFWQRSVRDGRLCKRIPTIEDHIAMIRRSTVTTTATRKEGDDGR